MPQSGFWKKAMGISALMRNWMEFDLFQIFQNCNGSSRSYSVFWLAHMIFPKPKDDNVIVTTPAAGVLQNPTVLPRVFGNAQQRINLASNGSCDLCNHFSFFRRYLKFSSSCVSTESSPGNDDGLLWMNELLALLSIW